MRFVAMKQSGVIAGEQRRSQRLINARSEKRMAGALTDDDTHEACASLADVDVGVLL